MAHLRTAWLTVCLLALTGGVRAQPLTPSINPSASPIVVSQQPEKVAVRPKVSDQRLVNIAFGATLNAGNTRSYTGNLGGRFGLIHDIHQLTVEALGTLGGARPAPDQQNGQGQGGERGRRVEWTSRNAIARVRYDLFLSTMDALFIAMQPRRDTIAGLDLRLQNQGGYLRNLYFPVDAHRFWTELGYDFTYDNFWAPEEELTAEECERIGGTSEQPQTPSMMGALATSPCREREPDFVHSARVFLGYTNRLSATAQLSMGAETLLDFTGIENVRVNGLAELTSSITHSFKLGLQVRVLFDNTPVEGREKYDLIAAAQLVYTFDSLAGALNAPCPVCDCTPQVQAARASCRASEPLRQIMP